MAKHNKNIQNLVLFTLCSALGLLLSGCDQNTSDLHKAKIWKKTIAGQELCVPYAYLNGPGASSDNPIIAIQTMYPDFKPLEKRPREYFEDDQWWRQVRFLISEIRTNKSFEELVTIKKDHLKSYAFIAEEHGGLMHFTQPEGEIPDKNDLWVEKSKENSALGYFSCSDKLSDISVPQCVYSSNYMSFFISASFDKKLLPHWQKIKEKTLQLIKSFDCESMKRRIEK